MPFIRIRVYKICNYNGMSYFFCILASKYDLMNGIIPFFLFNMTVFFIFTLMVYQNSKKKKKKCNYINAPKKFCNHFHDICVYYRNTHYRISQRQHVFLVYVIHSNCARLHNFFFFMMDYGENGYLHLKM